MDCDHWLYVAPVSRAFWLTYIASIAHVRGPERLCCTSIGAAVASPARLRTALRNGFDVRRWDGRALRLAAGATGSWEVVELLHRRGMDVTSEVLLGAARCRPPSLALLERVRRRRGGGAIESGVLRDLASKLVARGGGASVLAWAAALLLPWQSWPPTFAGELCRSAASAGNLTALRFLLSDTDSGGEGIFGRPSLDTAHATSVSTVSWGEEAQGPGPVYPRQWRSPVISGLHQLQLIDYAAASGDLATLQWLHEEQGAAFTAVTAEAAAYWGHLPACNMDALFTLTAQSRSASAEQLEWVRACGGGGGCSAGGMRQLLLAALLCNNRGVARWLRRAGAPWPDMTAVLAETQRGVLFDWKLDAATVATVLWALKEGCPFGKGWTHRYGQCEMVSGGRCSIERALHELGAPCGSIGSNAR
jgi:hypothetical protein